MRSLIIFLLTSFALNAAFARNLGKRSFNYNECGNSCSTPCNRPTNCNNNNNNNGSPCNNNGSPCNNNGSPCNNNVSPCNNNIVEKESDVVPVLIPFPAPSNTTLPTQPAHTTNNNTNTNNNTVDINIQNTIDNVNNISVPISLNSVNENSVTIHFEKLPAGNPANESLPTVAPSAVDCCLVLTPGKCDENGENCKEKREWICSEVCKGSTIIDVPEPPPELKLKNQNATKPTQVPLCKLANGTSIPCPTQIPVYSIPYQPAPQPKYYIRWLPIQWNITTRPVQQVSQVPIQPIYVQQRPVYTLPPQPVQQPVQTIQQVPRYVVVPQPLPQFIPTINQGQYLGQYLRNVGAGYWGAYQQSYQAPCSSQVPWQTPCGSSVAQY